MNGRMASASELAVAVAGSVDLCGQDEQQRLLKPASHVQFLDAWAGEDVAAVLTVCNRETVPVTVRGAGTGLVGGSVPVCGGVVLSLAKMNAILDLDSEKKRRAFSRAFCLRHSRLRQPPRDCIIRPIPARKPRPSAEMRRRTPVDPAR